MSWEALTAISTFATFLVIAASAFAALRQLCHMNAGNQISAALALMDKWSSNEYAKAIEYVFGGELDQRLSDPQYRRELMQFPISRLKHPEFAIISYWEQVGSLVKLGFISEDAFMDLASLVCIIAWEKLHPVIAIMRRRRGPQVMDNFEYLASRSRVWEERHGGDTFPTGAPHLVAEDRWPEDQAWNDKVDPSVARREAQPLRAVAELPD
ncbi:MAG: hypothetical protein M3007_00375, partial [Candidatus Eremiobacteraeota bacterium]|nr:hypothetical protein [Candidatus Eremiobacteraeota bacterium]